MERTQKFFTAQWLSHFKKEAAGFFQHTEVDVDDACQDAQIELMQSLQRVDDGRLTDAYVRTAYRNILIDLYRKHFGRARPPVWVQRLGALWVRIFELFCLQRRPVAVIADELALASTEDPPTQPGILKTVEQAVERLRREQACPKPRPKAVSLNAEADDEGPMDIPDADCEPAGRLHESELTALLSGLFASESQEILPDSFVGLSRKVAECWQAVSENLAMSDDERLMLRLVYQEGHSVNAAARILDLPAHQVRRPIKRVQQRIRSVFVEHGLSLEDFDV